MLDRAFLQARNLKPAPGIRSLPYSLPLPFARFHARGRPGSVSKTIDPTPVVHHVLPLSSHDDFQASSNY